MAVADVSDPAALAMAVAGLRAQLGPIDLLVNNAGAVGPIGPLWKVDVSAWWDTFEVNVRGPLLCAGLRRPTWWPEVGAASSTWAARPAPAHTTGR